MTQTPTPTPPRSKTMGAGIGLISVVGVATLLAILFRGGGSGSGGSGQGSGTSSGMSATTQAIAATEPTRPLKVRIEESSYVVNGQRLDLPAVMEMVGKVPSGDGPAVVVERPGTSRAKAEEELFAALDKQGVQFMRD